MSANLPSQPAALVGCAALLVAAAVLSFLALGKDDRSQSDRPAPAAASSPLPAQSGSNGGSAGTGRAAPAYPPGALNARELGFRLLALPDADEVLAGMRTLEKAAEQGDIEAQISLGRIYLQGVPAVPKDATRARDWFLRAAPSRHPSAAYFLGVMSQSGQGVKADPAEAARWFTIAAEGGSPDAMFLLANAYREGAGVPKDNAKAIELYEKAGEMEHPAALQALAMAYQYGEMGLTPDEAEHRRYAMEAEHAIKHRPIPP